MKPSKARTTEQLGRLRRTQHMAGEVFVLTTGQHVTIGRLDSDSPITMSRKDFLAIVNWWSKDQPR